MKIQTLLIGTMASICIVATPALAPADTGQSDARPQNKPSLFASKTDVELQGKIAAHIAKHGGEQRGKNQIVWAKEGVTMTFPAPTETKELSAFARATCRVGYYCIYEHAFSDRNGGAMLDFYNEGIYKLYGFGWNDLASAWENNQTDSWIGGGYDTINDELHPMFVTRSYSVDDWVGNDANDRVDTVVLQP